MNYKILPATIITSLLASFIFIFSLHFFGKWTPSKKEIPDNYISEFGVKPLLWEYSIISWDNHCVFLNSVHQTIVHKQDEPDMKYTFNNKKFSASFEFTIFDHFALLILFTLLLSPISYRLFRNSI